MTPAQLVKAVSLALDVPEETVATHDRNLVIAGLRTTGARGRHAPDMTHRDAARLFVAVLGSVRVKDSVETVQAFERTVHDSPYRVLLEIFEQERFQETPQEPPPVWFSDPAFDVLPAGHNFVDAVASLISEASAPVGDLDRYLQRFGSIKINCDTFKTGVISGRGYAYYRLKPAPASKAKPSQAYDQVEAHHKRDARHYGMHQSRDVPGSAIMLLGKAFRDNGLPFETTEEALDALLGSKKAPAKSKKVKG
jgi:hypothetical protein